jgi:hypothetical protein
MGCKNVHWKMQTKDSMNEKVCIVRGNIKQIENKRLVWRKKESKLAYGWEDESLVLTNF